MTKLTDMQLVLLTTTCQHEDGSLLLPPDGLGAQAARIRKAVEALIKKGSPPSRRARHHRAVGGREGARSLD